MGEDAKGAQEEVTVCILGQKDTTTMPRAVLEVLLSWYHGAQDVSQTIHVYPFEDGVVLGVPTRTQDGVGHLLAFTIRPPLLPPELKRPWLQYGCGSGVTLADYEKLMAHHVKRAGN